MELITILNRCHRFQGFLYQHARFSPDKKTIEIFVRPRKGSRAICSRSGSQACSWAGQFSRALPGHSCQAPKTLAAEGSLAGFQLDLTDIWAGL